MTEKTHSTPSSLWIILTAIGAGGLFAAIAARHGNHQGSVNPPSPAKVAPPFESVSVAGQPVSHSREPVTRISPVRSGIYLVLLVGCAAALIRLQGAAPQVGFALFVLLLVSSVAAALWQARAGMVAFIWNHSEGLRSRALIVVGPMVKVYAWAWQHRMSLSLPFMLLALALLILSVWKFGLTSRLDDTLELGYALKCLAGGAVALAIVLALRHDVISQAAVVRLPMPAVMGRINWFVTGIGVLALAFMTDYNRREVVVDSRLTISTDVQFILLVAGITLVIAGLAGLRSTGGMLMRLVQADAPRGKLVLVIAITLLGLVLRVWNLQDSMRFLIDEESFSSAMRSLRVDENVRLLSPFSNVVAFPYLFPYLQEQTVQVFGSNLIGLRMASVVVGTLTIPALVLLARTLFDLKTALLAALLLATFPPHIHFSRIGINNIADPLFGTLTLAFLARGLKSGRRMDFAAAGGMLGLTQYFYEAGRLLFPPLVVVWWVSCILFSRTERRIQWRGLLTTALAFMIISAPVYITLIGLDRPLFARMGDVNTGLPGSYWRALLEGSNPEAHLLYHIVPSFMAYINWPDSTLFYMGKYGLVLPLLQPLFFLGIIISLCHWRKPGMGLLVLWVLSTSLGNSLMVDSAAPTRYVVVFPALALAAAVGLRHTLPLIWPLPLPKMMLRLWVSRHHITLRWPPRHLERRFPRELMALGVVFACAQAVYYYGEHVPNYNTDFRLAKEHADGYDAALRSTTFLPNTTIYVIAPEEVSELETRGLLRLMREDLKVKSLPARRFTRDYIREISCQKDNVFFIEPDDDATLNKLKANFYLRAPERSPYADIIPDDRELLMYYAPYIPGMEKKYERCDQEQQAEHSSGSRMR